MMGLKIQLLIIIVTMEHAPGLMMASKPIHLAILHGQINVVASDYKATVFDLDKSVFF